MNWFERMMDRMQNWAIDSAWGAAVVIFFTFFIAFALPGVIG